MEYIYSFDSSHFLTLYEPPMAHVAAMVGHHIFLIGGYQTSYDSDNRTIMAFDKHSMLYFDVLNCQLDTIECTYDMESIGAFPTEFFCSSGMACCCFENRIYFFGGYSLSKQEAGNALYFIEIYKDINISDQFNIESTCNIKPNAKLKFLAGSHDQMSEESHKNFPSYRDKASIVYWKNQLIVFGGYGSHFQRTNSIETDQGHNFLAGNGEYISGSGNRGWTNQLLIFSLQTSNWINPATFGSVPCPRAAHSAAVTDDGKMFVFGGRLGMKNTAATVRSNQLFCLNLTTLHWSHVVLSDTGIIGRSWTTFTRVSNRSFFIIGGFSGDNVPLSDAYCVSIDGNECAAVQSTVGFQRAEWSPLMKDSSWIPEHLCSEPVSRMWHSSTLAPDGFVYVIGGCRNNLIYQVERIQTRLERVRAAPLSLYDICLWVVFLSRPILDRMIIPDRLFRDLVALSV